MPSRQYIRSAGKTPLECFLPYIEVQPNGCWYFTGAIAANGYGTFNRIIDGKKKACRAHRVSYELHKGGIPDGLDLDHKCHKPEECAGGNSCLHRRCVNPDHLEPCTREVNLSRGVHVNKIADAARNKTHCDMGHAFDEDNTRIVTSGERTLRRCMACHNERSRRYKREKRERRDRDSGQSFESSISSE